MLTDQQWKEFEVLCDGETYAQGDDVAAEAMLSAVKLAQMVLEAANGEMTPIARLALDALFAFGNWNTLPLHENYWYWCMVENYGEDDADYYISKEGWKPGKPGKEGD